MRKILAILVVLTVAFSVSAANLMSGGKVTFLNISSPTQGDTCRNADTMACVIDQIESGVLASKMTLFLPPMLGFGDTCTVILQELYGANAGRNFETRNWANQGSVADGVEAPYSDSMYIGKTCSLGTYHYRGKSEGRRYTWTPGDSVMCPRVRICIKGELGNTVLTGIDSLATTGAYIYKLFAPKP